MGDNMEKQTILVTGGAGYIGLNVVNELLKNNFKVVVADNLSNSYKGGIDSIVKSSGGNCIFCNVDLKDKQSLEKVFKSHNFLAVIHLAGKKYVGESFKKTTLYEVNNIFATKVLLDTMKKFNVKKIVFSSSITVYGNVLGKVSEEKELAPISPYAKQKAEGEKMIVKWAEKNGSDFVVLRLSNPIGAGEGGKFGENSKSKNKGVVPYLVDCAVQKQKIVLNGNDHPTRDGTTIRDYVFVGDVAKAFAKAVTNGNGQIINVGSGEEGFTVLELLKEVEKATLQKLDYSFRAKLEGDISKITTNNKKLQKEFGIKPTRDLFMMIKTHYDFKTKNRED